jgi:hypothetical protein
MANRMISSVEGLDALLEKSAATEEFKEAVQGLEDRQKSPLIEASLGAPPVKLMRTIAKLLEEEPGLAVERVSVDGRSGCSDFSGKLRVNGGEQEYEFSWDCKWRAEQEGWKDPWGYPDQARAAQSFGYQCFKRFNRVK